jgi:uncharacterized protein
MRPEVESAALDFIARTVPASGAEALEMVFIGGEPLVRKEMVLRAGAAAAEAVRRQGMAFEWQIITNGVALDLPFARAMSALGPGAIKVTLDGDRETHDRARVYLDGRGTFDRIFSAMAAVARECPGIKMRVDGNFRPGQERSYEALLDRIAREGLSGKLDLVRFKPVTERGGCQAACGSHAVGILVQLAAAARRRGIRFLDADGAENVSPCELHWDHTWTIDPEGRLYKCLAVAGKPELAIGDVWKGVTRVDPLVARRPWDKGCDDGCPFVPVCLGGCMGGSVATGGRIGEVACDREALEFRFRRSVVRRYLDEFHPDSEKEASPREVNAAA